MQIPESPRELSRSETITALAHYYRAEVQRSLAWRERLDRTTNWAVATTAALFSLGFSHPELPHAFFAFGLAIVYMLLFIESRRYRFFDAYEYRVRLMNQNFIYNILAHGVLAEDPDGQEDEAFWRAELASDLRYPQYKMDLRYAMGRRLNANYMYLMVILFAAWMAKIQLHPVQATSWTEFFEHAAVGPIPAWGTFGLMLLFALHLYRLSRLGRRTLGGRDLFRPPKMKS